MVFTWRDLQPGLRGESHSCRFHPVLAPGRHRRRGAGAGHRRAIHREPGTLDPGQHHRRGHQWPGAQEDRPMPPYRFASCRSPLAVNRSRPGLDGENLWGGEASVSLALPCSYTGGSGVFPQRRGCGRPARGLLHGNRFRAGAARRTGRPNHRGGPGSGCCRLTASAASAKQLPSRGAEWHPEAAGQPGRDREPTEQPGDQAEPTSREFLGAFTRGRRTSLGSSTVCRGQPGELGIGADASPSFFGGAGPETLGGPWVFDGFGHEAGGHTESSDCCKPLGRPPRRGRRAGRRRARGCRGSGRCAVKASGPADEDPDAAREEVAGPARPRTTPSCRV